MPKTSSKVTDYELGTSPVHPSQTHKVDFNIPNRVCGCDGALSSEAENLTLFPGERWFLAYTAPYREAIAKTHLGRQGFRSFLPRYVKTVRHARKMRDVIAPMFPRYLFVALNLERDRWRSVASTTGVTNLFMMDDRPVPVRQGIVETLIQSADTAGRLRFFESLEPGQKVRLIAGPFAQTLGILRKLNDTGRVEVLLEIMGGGVRVRLPRSSVELAV
ncbi:transcriptional activator RfaH [Methylocapsa sp. D3K7]|uniref:transcription termination/antitermination protein NusG n=1 Tax=Methylocapsa sp. D3K7 TaxID=3041435 RepID=UPI00244E91B1|nr:transcriptional activator RfaH [Methylocapsa sp. D3K7]WGJ16198.1 transcriptional activator RfaH [Methylocapsa sp. D3K7]